MLHVPSMNLTQRRSGKYHARYDNESMLLPGARSKMRSPSKKWTIRVFLVLVSILVFVKKYSQFESYVKQMITASRVDQSAEMDRLAQEVASLSLRNAAHEWSEAKAATPEVEATFGKKRKIALVTMKWGGGDYKAELNSALETHRAYVNKHGYELYMLDRVLFDMIWSKPSYILSIILQELAKPPTERLEWLVWADVDTLVMNPNVELESFLPPRNFGDVNLMTTNDVFGLNNGVFFIRINQWAVKLLSHTLAFPFFRPEVRLGNSDQSAMFHLLEDSRFSKHALIVPQHLFNGYRIGMHEGENAKPGALFMHFPGGNKQFMGAWLGYIEGNKNTTWNVPYEETSYPKDIKAFWDATFRRKMDGFPLYISSDV